MDHGMSLSLPPQTPGVMQQHEGARHWRRRTGQMCESISIHGPDSVVSSYDGRACGCQRVAAGGAQHSFPRRIDRHNSCMFTILVRVLDLNPDPFLCSRRHSDWSAPSPGLRGRALHWDPESYSLRETEGIRHPERLRAQVVTGGEVDPAPAALGHAGAGQFSSDTYTLDTAR